MMDDVTVCNMALGHIGADSISTLTNSRNKNAEFCNTYFEPARDATLEGFDWNFARVRRTLAELSDAAPDDWAHAYTYPTDCVKFRRILTANRRTNDLIPYEIALKEDQSSKYILTELRDAVGIYTARVQNLDLWEMLAIEAMSWKLASLLVVPILRKIDAVPSMDRMFQIKLSTAQAGSANETQRDKDPESTFVEARY